MKRGLRMALAGALLGSVLALTGCEGSGENVQVSASVGMYYGTSYYSPWYYGGGYYPPGAVIPPGGGYRPPGGVGDGVRPPSNTPRPTPMPTRPAGGGGGRRR